MKNLFFPMGAVALVATFGCGGSSNGTSNDTNGRPRIICTHDSVPLAVKVISLSGDPVDGAAVTATNTGTGKALLATTDGFGITHSINEEIGSGTVRLTASLNSSSSQTAQVEWLCNECNCTVSPQTVTLQLKP